MATSFYDDGRVTIPNLALQSPTQLTVEANVRIEKVRKGSTIICHGEKPHRHNFRLGFHDQTTKPEWALTTTDGQFHVATAEFPIPLSQWAHIAGTFDGATMRLYVNGVQAASKPCVGELLTTSATAFIAAAQANSLKGGFTGTLAEVRLWHIARTVSQLARYAFDLVDLDEPGLSNLWPCDDLPIPDANRYQLTDRGWSQFEIRTAGFASWFAREFSQLAPTALNERARMLYGAQIKSTLIVKLSDGILAFYSPHAARTLEDLIPPLPQDQRADPIVATFEFEATVAEFLSTFTADVITTDDATSLNPATEASDPFHSSLTEAAAKNYDHIPRVKISSPVGTRTNTFQGRIHAICPLTTQDHNTHRIFSWLFLDLWLSPITRRSTYENDPRDHLARTLFAINHLALMGFDPKRMVDNGGIRAEDAAFTAIRDLQQLLDRPDVDEVRDIQPFLAQERNWFILDSAAAHVWPEKRLGSKLKVDYVIKRAAGDYLAIEIESPRKTLYTQRLDQTAELNHAIQQVRDYCNFIDSNLAYCRDTEQLTDIYRPTGLVVIGRSTLLSAEARRKLREYNADALRFKVSVYDDLIANALQVVNSFRRLTQHTPTTS